MANPTPGPWHAEAERLIYAAKKKCVAMVPSERGSHTKVDAANARLIAASPDLLAACKEALRHVEHELDCPIAESGHEPNCTCRVSRMRAAVAKAEGRTP